MNHQVLIDTGPLVAILSPKDTYHQICVDTLKQIQPPLITCWSVLTEAHYLLRNNKQAIQSLFTMIESDLLKVVELPQDSVLWLKNFALKYHDIGAQLADISLCYLAEVNNIDVIFTLDKKDFSIYRVKGNKSVTIIP
jgi:predicted nucleic acid-binding protein